MAELVVNLVADQTTEAYTDDLILWMASLVDENA